MVTLNRSRNDDRELARRIGAGDTSAFATLDARHRDALTRYAGGLLRRSEHDAEDVVQDVLIRAHEALRAGDGPDELRPWLYRLTRNRAIDEVRRKRWGDESLDPDHTFTGDSREDPENVLRSKETIRRLIEDLADLPVRQREALLARELDDQTAEQVAAQLGVSVTAAHNLATRARENLIRTRDARDAGCADIRAALLDAHERGVRPTEHALRHRNGCDACRAYQRDIRRLSRQLHALNPVFGLPLLAGVAKLAGVGGTKAAAGVVLAVAVAATGGIVVLGSDVHSPGDPSPFRLIAIRDSQGRVVTRGNPIPEGFTVVTARVRLPAGPSTMPKDPRGPFPTVTLPCPKGMKVAGMQLPAGEIPYIRVLGFTKDSIPGWSTSARMQIAHPGLTRPLSFTVGIDCRRPDANGSIAADKRKLRRALRRGEHRLGHVCTTRYGVLLRRTPGGEPQDYISRGAPVAIQRRNAAGTWASVVSDGILSIGGWMKTSDLCP
jgi:RNA polymerase sigma factor (sigma-70 family)